MLLIKGYVTSDSQHQMEDDVQYTRALERIEVFGSIWLRLVTLTTSMSSIMELCYVMKFTLIDAKSD